MYDLGDLDILYSNEGDFFKTRQCKLPSNLPSMCSLFWNKSTWRSSRGTLVVL